MADETTPAATEQHYATLKNGLTYYMGATRRFEQGVEVPVTAEERAKLEEFATDDTSVTAVEGEARPVPEKRQKFFFRVETTPAPKTPAKGK